jgi:hypothetical protein
MYHAIDRRAVQHTFTEYVSTYNAADPKIALKIRHTYRVAGLCDRIGQSVGIDNSDLLWLCGMLHDIGRFEQVKRYNTFVDAASIEHAAICLVFELVYPISRQIAREEGFVDQRLSFESDNPNTQAWFAYMRENVWKA